MGSHRAFFSGGCFLGDFFVLGCMYVCMYVCMHTIYVCMCVYIMYVSIDLCMYVCIYISICVDTNIDIHSTCKGVLHNVK